MKKYIIEAFNQMQWKNMNKVNMKDFKYISYWLIRKAEQEAIANEIYDYRGYGYSMNYEQNILPLVEELEEAGYEFSSDLEDDSCLINFEI